MGLGGVLHVTDRNYVCLLYNKRAIGAKSVTLQGTYPQGVHTLDRCEPVVRTLQVVLKY